ncbi:MAG TPA: hypothetical protein VIK35_12940 [Verrucomicrobiae bacterium]
MAQIKFGTDCWHAVIAENLRATRKISRTASSFHRTDTFQVTNGWSELTVSGVKITNGGGKLTNGASKTTNGGLNFTVETIEITSKKPNFTNNPSI